jgi:hypothetical protein
VLLQPLPLSTRLASSIITAVLLVTLEGQYTIIPCYDRPGAVLPLPVLASPIEYPAPREPMT